MVASKKRLGKYETQYKMVKGWLVGAGYTALTANIILGTTRLTNNVIQCERDGLKVIHEDIPNNGKRPYVRYSLKNEEENIKKAYELLAFYALKSGVKNPTDEMSEAA